MTDPMPPLDPRWIEALDAGDEGGPPAIDVEARVRARLERAIPEMRRRAGGGGGGSAIGGGRILPFTHLAAFVLGGVGGAALWASLQRTPAPAVTLVARPAPARPAGDEAPAASAPEPPPPAPRTETRPSAGPASASQLAAERRLLDAAHLALTQGDPAAAERKLDAHRARFPHGLLAEERDAMVVQALVKEGRYDAARAQAIAFERRSANSLFRSAVQAAIDSIPVTATPARPNSSDEGVAR